jgi:hypothetical protein
VKIESVKLKRRRKILLFRPAGEIIAKRQKKRRESEIPASATMAEETK